MPFVLIIIGIMLVVTAIKDTQSQFGELLVGDFTGQGNFFFFATPVLLIGFVGYIPAFRTFSRVFLALMIVAIIFANKTFFSLFQSGLVQGSAQAPSSGSGGNSGGPSFVPMPNGGNSSGGSGSVVVPMPQQGQ